MTATAGGMGASSTVLANDTILTVFSTSWESKKREHDGTIPHAPAVPEGRRRQQLQVLRWRVPSREIVGGNGYFSP